MAASETPYRSGMAAGVGVVLLAGLAVAIADVVHAGGGALAVLGLWALLVVPVALATGVILAGGNATWGTGWVRRGLRGLRDDAELDKKAAALLLAGAAVAVIYALLASKLALRLVGNVERKTIGALL